MHMINRKIIIYEELTSTNDKLKELAQNGAESGTVIRAEMQTGGRGRMGRSWVSKRGEGLYLSILLKPRKKIKSASQLSLVAGLGVCTTAEHFLQNGVNIKWPNDVLCNGRKLSGILTETVIRGDNADYFITGIGININNTAFPTEIENKATSFYMESGKNVKIESLTTKLIDELDILYEGFFNGDFSYLSEYKKRCVNINNPVKLIYDGTEINGVATDINDLGELRVETQTGKFINVNSGEVSVRGISGYI